MKVLISADIEGVAGVFHPEQTRAGNGEYEAARRWMTLEANAAIEGAFAGGATQVWVNDSHGGFRNLLPDLLDARAQVVLGKPRTLGMMAGLEYGAALVFMIGYHAKSQTRGILAHTINSFAFARVSLNGVEVGEAGLYGALAEEYGARVALLSGDDVFAEETAPRFPGARFVVTKSATGHASGVTQSPAYARDAIGTAAREVVRQHLAEGHAPHATRAGAKPVECELRVQTTALADLFCQWPTLTRVDAVTLRFDAASAEDAVRMLNCLSAMSFMLR
ncbi:M55 family metallopeptidase [Paraburkholderia sp. DD10]|jgi:D-amino peptidase|uniref:D-aminopeptidase DppA. Metallo peptidase. MEROPS family M55 n=1 Tax=Paraburkholderia terricola TaxID=169427 RepID=A0A1M6JHG6_9BURK|nr:MULTISPECIES: M55 family metallopeptidase [Paraburkholderia]ORC48782.1 aminopeptidase [Burkholderia sp. A27]SDN62110.1 D-aminopeptidase DppA. Metallo peptidase. MEROPS family M55 [Paraburkholderia sediminicola]SHJ46188.1 D-aminopeptidase DppA. Metallo peptidase. MEROPS family M55 [Paraburkholderia terricola]